eukprot:TRINITY_DN418_c3_g1_i1.p1 TRINITY_DN418_c3_g1~~TRINITY_DN418_c3_g1_i1.p1  ORF type:complete len:195 (+),score=21.86 TRINITY_DN418_c3_g1_i1:52-585(+)
MGGVHTRETESKGVSQECINLRPVWVRDDMAYECTECLRRFTIFKRRHHCRACGFIFCSSCLQMEGELTKLGYVRPVKQCFSCIVQLRQQKQHMMSSLILPSGSTPERSMEDTMVSLLSDRQTPTPPQCTRDHDDNDSLGPIMDLAREMCDGYEGTGIVPPIRLFEPTPRVITSAIY